MFRRFVAGSAGLVLLLMLWPAFLEAASATDPWARLRQTVSSPAQAEPSLALERRRRELEAFAAWQQLREVLVPFAVELEKEETQPGHPGRLARAVDEKLAPFALPISEAAARFDIPEAILKAVIMVESGGDPKARAGSTSAAGLMQTIRSTFAAARRELISQGVEIANDPCDPRASILAGSWYLDKMYVQAFTDGQPGMAERGRLAAWRRPLEYYYAGPGHGRKAANRILIYRDGKRVVINKKSYSDKVLVWAGKLASDSPAAGIDSVRKNGGRS
jgi:soluble lytic murein transglycosylase-like protein